MNEDTAPNTAATTPPDEPKVESSAHAHPHGHEYAHEAAHEADGGANTPVPESVVPEAEASVEQVTAPDPEHAPEPAPAPPPELADVEAAADSESVPVPESEPANPEAGAEGQPAQEETPAKPAKRPKAPKAPKSAPATAAGATPDPADAPAPTSDVTPSEAPEVPAEPAPVKKKWYAIKVQSGREDTIKAAILRKVAIEGLEEFFGRIEIPYEEEIVKKAVRVKDKKTGEYTTQEKKVTRKKKKFQGYLFAELEFNDRILYLFRETSGVGDFLNLRTKPGQQPTPEPMPDHEVTAMLTGVAQKDPSKKPKVKLDFEKGDRVRIREGPFANSEGDVKAITEPKDPTDSTKITVVVTLWGRPVDVDLDHWQVEKV